MLPLIPGIGLTILVTVLFVLEQRLRYASGDRRLYRRRLESDFWLPAEVMKVKGEKRLLLAC